MRIFVDTGSGEKHIRHSIRAAVNVVNTTEDDTVLIGLTGNRKNIEDELSHLTYDKDRITVHDATQVMKMDDKIRQILRKTDTSIAVACHRAERYANLGTAVVSAGNTGGIWATVRNTLECIEGIKPSILTTWPTDIPGKPTLFLDGGLTLELTGEELKTLTLIGICVCRALFPERNPIQAGILTVGPEESKGTPRVILADTSLRSANVAEYGGKVEPKDIHTGKTAVIACEGHVGNAVVKSGPSTLEFFLRSLKKKPILRKIIFALIYLDLGKERYEELTARNGGIILGTAEVSVIKVHGDSEQHEFEGGIRQAIKAVRADLPRKLAKMISTLPSNENKPPGGSLAEQPINE